MYREYTLFNIVNQIKTDIRLLLSPDTDNGYSVTSWNKLLDYLWLYNIELDPPQSEYNLSRIYLSKSEDTLDYRVIDPWNKLKSGAIPLSHLPQFDNLDQFIGAIEYLPNILSYTDKSGDTISSPRLIKERYFWGEDTSEDFDWQLVMEHVLNYLFKHCVVFSDRQAKNLYRSIFMPTKTTPTFSSIKQSFSNLFPNVSWWQQALPFIVNWPKLTQVSMFELLVKQKMYAFIHAWYVYSPDICAESLPPVDYFIYELKNGYTPLMDAFGNQQINLSLHYLNFLAFIDLKTSIEILLKKNENQVNAIMLALRYANLEQFKELWKLIENANDFEKLLFIAKDNKYNNFLHYLFYNKLEIIKFLFAKFKSFKHIQLLLNHLNAKNSEKITPFMALIQNQLPNECIAITNFVISYIEDTAKEKKHFVYELLDSSDKNDNPILLIASRTKNATIAQHYFDLIKKYDDRSHCFLTRQLIHRNNNSNALEELILTDNFSAAELLEILPIDRIENYLLRNESFNPIAESAGMPTKKLFMQYLYLLKKCVENNREVLVWACTSGALYLNLMNLCCQEDNEAFNAYWEFLTQYFKEDMWIIANKLRYKLTNPEDVLSKIFKQKNIHDVLALLKKINFSSLELISHIMNGYYLGHLNDKVVLTVLLTPNADGKTIFVNALETKDGLSDVSNLLIAIKSETRFTILEQNLPQIFTIFNISEELTKAETQELLNTLTRYPDQLHNLLQEDETPANFLHTNFLGKFGMFSNTTALGNEDVNNLRFN